MKDYVHQKQKNCNHCIYNQEISRYLDMEDDCSFNKKYIGRIVIEEDCPFVKLEDKKIYE